MRTSTRLAFETLHNTRDLGGMKTADGRTVRSGCLIRSGNLHQLSDSDQEKLMELIDTVIDFRTDNERREEPDMNLPGVVNLHLPALDDFGSAGISRDQASQNTLAAQAEMEAEAARQLMADMYTRFPLSEQGNLAYRSFLKVLLKHHEKAVLWHCSAGKDRTGIAAVIIEQILGIPEETIQQDYLATNAYQKENLEQFRMFVQRQAGRSDLSEETIRYLFGADASYLQAFRDSIEQAYGSFEAYVHQALQLSEDDIQTLRRDYLI